MRRLAISTLLACLAPFLGGDADAAQAERVKFKAGAISATINGAVTGYDTHNYLIGARAGQAMSILFSANNNACYFNLIEPGADSAVHFGEVAGNEFARNLAKSGDYRAEVYLMRSEARRGKTCKYSITFEISGKGADNGEGDAVVPGTDFNATGEMPCARNKGQPMGVCKFGVTRKGDGSGSITVFWADSGDRVIFFKNNVPSAFDHSEADGNAKMKVTKEVDLFSIRIGNQRFEIPEAVMSGG